MDLRQLTYFVAVAEERHFGRAAVRLHLSQPPLTRQVQALEDELGAKLFVRTSRGVELTQAGAMLLGDARDIHTLVDRASVRARLAGAGKVGRLDIGVYGTAMFDLLPRLLTSFRAARPQVQLVLQHGRAPELLVALRRGRIEVAFERMVPREDDLKTELVATEPMVVALNVGHALAANEKIDVTDLRDEEWIMPAAPESQLADAGLALARAHGFEPRVFSRVDDVVTGLLHVAAGVGIQLSPRSAAALRMPGVVYRPLQSRVPAQMDLHCFYRRGERSPLLDELLADVRAFRRAAELGDTAFGLASHSP
jgi:DNA-binding transcriptional LysR family regulator